MEPDLRFALLGPVRAWRGQAELDLGAPQQRAVLAVLLLAGGRQVPLGTLIDALWATDPPRSSVSTVRTYVSRLRRCLGTASGAGPDGLIESAGVGYVLVRGPAGLDLDEFARLTEAARAARHGADPVRAVRLLGQALELCQGEPLAGLPGQFAGSQRSRLAELRMTALEERLALDIELGGHAAAAAELPGLLAAEPLRERLSELLMLALYRSGRQAEALAVFGATRRLLGDELGIDPGPALRDLHERILRMDGSLMGPARPQPGRPQPGRPNTDWSPLALASPAARSRRRMYRRAHCPRTRPCSRVAALSRAC